MSNVGFLKGMLPEQRKKIDLKITLANTYHLGIKPGLQVRKSGGFYKFMNWDRCLSTD